ncbi:MAG: TMEM175 family protein [Dehalococcoidia bacterium]|nr:TMEM175 family protein [Dehalococcoidia bacterium]
MPGLSTDENSSLPTTRRIEALSDGIFAIAMTLLVLNLALPQAIEHTSQSLLKMLTGQLYDFFDYVISFILLAIFWIMHHQQFHYIQRTDTKHLWINIFMLMFVALVPFSTSIVGDYGVNVVGDIFFSANILILGFLFLANWVYATSNHRLVRHNLDSSIINQSIRRTSVIPIVCLVTMAVSLLSPYWSLWILLSIPLIMIFKPFRKV